MIFRKIRENRQKRTREIAKAVHAELSASNGWEKFLPPVVLRDTLYMVTENGSIYAMKEDFVTGMNQIIQIRSR